MEGVLDQWQFHQPLVACTLIGLVSGQLEAGIILGGTLQMMALGWANVGAAVAPDAALASVASAILMVIAVGNGADQSTAISTAIAVAVPLSVAGLFLTMIVRTLAIPVVHIMDGAAAKGNFAAIDFWSIVAICMQGIRIAIPAAALCFIPSDAVMGALNMMPAWLSDGMSIGGGMVAAVGYAMVINMMATKEVWPFFALGFCLAAISELTLIALGVIGISLASFTWAQGACQAGRRHGWRLGRPARRHPGRLRVGREERDYGREQDHPFQERSSQGLVPSSVPAGLLELRAYAERRLVLLDGSGHQEALPQQG